MNIKSLLLGSVITLGSIFGTVGAAEAAPSRCWGAAPGQTVTSVYCDHYLPSQGEHVVFIDGVKLVFELFDSGRATISVDGSRSVAGSWVYHSKGGIQVTNNHTGYFFIFERN